MIIGLTGGIGSGKSTVSNILRELGIEIVDADKVSKEISEKKENIEKMIEIFGKEITDEKGRIVREKLREVVFSDRELLNELNGLLHPQIDRYFKEKRGKIRKDEIVIFDIPLLFETNMEYLCDKVVLIGAEREVQIKRVMKRDSVNRELAEKMVDKQMSFEEKEKKADIVIMNDTTFEHLETKVKNLYKELKSFVKTK